MPNKKILMLQVQEFRLRECIWICWLRVILMRLQALLPPASPNQGQCESMWMILAVEYIIISIIPDIWLLAQELNYTRGCTWICTGSLPVPTGAAPQCLYPPRVNTRTWPDPRPLIWFMPSSCSPDILYSCDYSLEYEQQNPSICQGCQPSSLYGLYRCEIRLVQKKR